MDHPLLFFYIIKRLFLFLDEWGWYIVMLYLLKKKSYKSLIFVFLFGFLCIYTSYHNIEIIEQEILGIEQKVFIIDASLYDYLKSIIYL